MDLNERLFKALEKKASETMIEAVSIGLRYTAVCTSEGGIGLSYTYFRDNKSCTAIKLDQDIEDQPALGLLEFIKSKEPLQRSLGLATINAVNHQSALTFPEDRKNDILLNILNIKKNTKVAMVGYIGPLVHKLQKMEAKIEIIDQGRNLGDYSSFKKKLAKWAESLILTSTSLLNNSTEDILKRIGPSVRTVLLGPSTPLIAEPFSNLPVHVLAGTVPQDKEKTLKAIRHGQGTPVLQKFGRKPYLEIKP